ncbi:MAG: type IV-A pilus assembly ATPase PilB [Pseudomonadales bacterium]|jgi:type IV pilus assembly protein PilB|nr:type IV-A pilus assembly ATPase PilB [Pseudomonadales bacterium]
MSPSDAPLTAPLPGLARTLVAARLLTPELARRSCEQARQRHLPLPRLLVDEKLLPSLAIAEAAARAFGLPLVDLDTCDMQQLTQTLIDARLLRQHQVVPLARHGARLCLGVADPSAEDAFAEIRFYTGLALELVVVEQDKLHRTLSALLDELPDSDIVLDQLDSLHLESELEPGANAQSEENALDEAPIVRFVNQLLGDAIARKASDIHLEPYEKLYRVRLRLDGLLKEVARPPPHSAARIAARLKIMAGCDVAERRLPQDGRIRLTLARGKAVDLRLSTLPTLWGEKLVLRILDANSAQLGIDALGFTEGQKQRYLDALGRRQGMILVTGPTGSGKTVTLYSGLNILNTSERNISTAEDPVEINLEGINQVAVNTKVGLDFASALRAFLRQNPDVMMVGEIRDLETAQIAIQAAQTGHLVLSTLHTNSAPETLTRLRGMGIANYNLATSLSLIVAQRLARRLCPHCKQPLHLPPHALLEAGFNEQQIPELSLFEAAGCACCNDGYKGRIGCYEVLPISERIARAIMSDADALSLAALAREEGYIDLRAAVLDKVAQGLTSLQEANRLL